MDDKPKDKPTEMTGEQVEALPIEQKVKYRYEHSQGSIQDIARVYRLTVNEVLQIIGETDIMTVEFGGDLIDPTDAGPGAQMNYGEKYDVRYTTN